MRYWLVAFAVVKGSDPCEIIYETPIRFARRWNGWINDYFENPNEFSFNSATSLSNLDAVCRDFTMPIVIMNGVLRQKLIGEHQSGRRIARTDTLVIDVATALHSLGTASIEDLIAGGLVSPSQLSLLFTHWFRFLPIKECRPFDYCGSWGVFTLNGESGCTMVQLRGLGRAIGLAVYLHVVLPNAFNTALPSILLGKTSGWSLSDLRADNIWHFNSILKEFIGKHEATQNDFSERIDFYIYDRIREVHEAVRGGFQEIVPRSTADGFVSAENLTVILLGYFPPVAIKLRPALETDDTPIQLSLMLSYIDESPITAISLFRLTTGLELPPVGGLPVMVPSMSVELVSCAAGAKIYANQAQRILYLPDCNSIAELNVLLAEVITPKWDLL